MKKIRFAAVIIPALALGFFTIHPANAMGMRGGLGRGLDLFESFAPSPDQLVAQHQALFQDQATLLGISIDEVKNAWAEGKSMQQLMKEKNITQDQVAARRKDLEAQKLKSTLQLLVDKGVITQAQADKRLQTLQGQKNTPSTPRMMGKPNQLHHGFRK